MPSATNRGSFSRGGMPGYDPLPYPVEWRTWSLANARPTSIPFTLSGFFSLIILLPSWTNASPTRNLTPSNVWSPTGRDDRLLPLISRPWASVSLRLA